MREEDESMDQAHWQERAHMSGLILPDSRSPFSPSGKLDPQMHFPVDACGDESANEMKASIISPKWKKLDQNMHPSGQTCHPSS